MIFPEITVTDLAAKLKSEAQFILLDVREPFELTRARIEDARLELAPISLLSQQGTNGLSEAARSREATIFVICHHGNRSAQVAAWLFQQGWKNVFNVRGGIDEYARQVDPSVGLY